MVCIFCINLHPISDVNPYTHEHVFPEAIGGSLILKKMVCSKCNSSVISKIDNQLTDHPLVLIERNRLQLKSKGRDIPLPIKGFTDSFGRKIKLNLKKAKMEIYPTIVEHEESGFFIYIPGTEVERL